MSNFKKKHGAGKMVRTALLTAIILVMAFTPLEYFKTGGLSITLLPVPVIIGAIVMGPTTGTVLGLAYGIKNGIDRRVVLYAILLVQVLVGVSTRLC